MSDPSTPRGDHDRTLRLGDNVNTDEIIPARRCTSADPEHLKHYAFEHQIGEGTLAARYDRIEAGRNFGCGSSREHAPIALRAAGIETVRAESFGDIFRRNSVNIGLPLECTTEPRPDPMEARIVASGGLSAFTHRRRRGEEAIPASETPRRPMTLTEKLLARASGNAFVAPGERVFARVDLAMSHDAVCAPVADIFRREFGAGARIWDASKLVLVADHFIQVNDVRRDERALALHREMVRFAEEQGCRLYDTVAPGEAAGICHLLLPEEGLVRPGMVVAGTDSHTCTYGSLGCFSFGVGTTDMANLLATGDVWIRVPPTHCFDLEGELPPDCSAKDVILFILGKIGCDGASGAVMELRGSAVASLPMEERMTLSNMAVECGAVCGIVASDSTTDAYLRDRPGPAEGTFDAEPLEGDPDAEYESVRRFDLSSLVPQVAKPPRPDRVVPVASLGEVPITRAFIGSCTGGKLHDLAQAASVLAGRHVAPGVQMFVVPASQAVRVEAERRGYWKIFEQAGVTLLKSGCGACINAGRGTLDAQEVGVYATNRNFQGRSGDPTGRSYLASPRVVAISAVTGKITDRLQ